MVRLGTKVILFLFLKAKDYVLSRLSRRRAAEAEAHLLGELHEIRSENRNHYERLESLYGAAGPNTNIRPLPPVPPTNSGGTPKKEEEEPENAGPYEDTYVFV